MQRLNRPVLALGLVALLAVAAAWLFGGGAPGAGGPDKVEAFTPFTNTTSCSDVYLGFPPVKGGPPVAGALRVAKSLSRLEVDGGGNPIATTLVTYLGPDLTPDNLIPIPDKPPSVSPCTDGAKPNSPGPDDKTDMAKLGPEANQLNTNIKLQILANQERPTAVPPNLQVGPVGDANGDTVPDVKLTFDTCVFSEATGMWSRTNVNQVVQNKGPQAVNYGEVWLMVGTTSPVGGDPTTCIPLGTYDPTNNEDGGAGGDCGDGIDNGNDRVRDNGGGGFAPDPDCYDNPPGALINPQKLRTGPAFFGATTVTRTRTATTDFPAPPPGVIVDPDGCNPKPCVGGQALDGDTLPDDWDGDGCPDWDELSPVPATRNGMDPFNPNDCDKNWDGVYNLLTVVAPSGKTANGTPTPGIYFHCISRIIDNKNPPPPAPRPISSTLVCYTDNGVTGGGSSYARYITKQDGLAGPPPPPPYGFGDLSTLNGTYDPVSNQITFAGCFNDVEGELGPAVYVTATLGKQQGLVGINANETRANCKAGTPSGGPAAEATVVKIAEQKDNFDHDSDGCTDAQELDPNPATRQGRDPYNPYDCDKDFYSITNILVTVARQDVVKATGVPIAGAYYHCIADNQPGPGGPPSIITRPQCYIDIPGIDVNPHVAGAQGDGLGGVSPPPPFAEVHSAHTQLSGTIKTIPATPEAGADCANAIDDDADGAINDGCPAVGAAEDKCLDNQDDDGDAAVNDGCPTVGGTNFINSEGCFSNVHGVLGPNIYVRSIVNGRSGQGTVDIWNNRPDCTVPGGAPTVNDAIVQTSEQGKTIDSDNDNCSDKEELGDLSSSGGLRDPYNSGDFMSVHTGPVANLVKDQVVSVADISAIVARFGSNDAGGATKINRNSDPKSRPPKTGYHPSYDRGGPIPNGGKPSTARQTPATTGSGAGSVTVADISATVAQFGASCAGPP
jgi:hypothetical protein